jgi:hypothetical protein
MQVLSQLSYNPTIGPLIGAAIGRHPGRCYRLLGGRVRVPVIAGLHHPGSLQIERTPTAPASTRFAAEYSVPRRSNQSHRQANGRVIRRRNPPTLPDASMGPQPTPLALGLVVIAAAGGFLVLIRPRRRS